MITLNIFAAIAIGFEALVMWRYFETLFEREKSVLIAKSSVIIGYSLFFIVFIFHSIYINVIAFTLLNFFILFHSYDAKIRQCLFHSSYITVCMILTEFLPLITISLLFEDVHLYYQNIYIGLVFVFISKLLFFILIQISINFFNKDKDTNFTDKSFMFRLYLTPFSTIVMFTSFMYILVNLKLSDIGAIILLVTSALILFCNILVFSDYYHNQKINRQYTETKIHLQKIETDKQFYKMLDEQQENQKILIHDITKHLFMIKQYIDCGETIKANGYIERIQNSKVFKMKINFCDNNTLNLILSRYYSMFKSANISPNFTILTGVNFIDDEDLTSILGNIFDNVYEATLNNKDANIDLLIKYSDDDNATVFRIINSYSHEIEIVNNNLITNKNDTYNHGYGNKIITQTLKKYNGDYNFYIDEENKKFHTFISIPCPKE